MYSISAEPAKSVVVRENYRQDIFFSGELLA